MGPSGAIIAILRNPTARRALLIGTAVLLFGIVVIVASIVATIQTVLSQNCSTTANGGGTSYVSQLPSEVALSDIPGNYLDTYRAAGEQYGLDWAVVAAVGAQETQHGGGGGCATSSVGARGPMQFMPQTWTTIGVDGNGDGEKNPCDFEDAIPATARYLVDLGAPESYRDALCGYYGACADKDADYANEVLAKADAYRAAADGGSEESSESAAAPVGTSPAQINLFELPVEPMLAQAPGSSRSSGTGKPAQGWDLVDDERNIDYQVDSAYAEYFEAAAEDWNALGGVSLQPASSDAETDLVVTDGPLGGQMGRTYSDGRIVLDPAAMDGATDNARQAAVSHEFGHALGLGHTEAQSVMQTPIVSNASTNNAAPTSYDEQLYARSWGNGADDGSGDGQEGPEIEGSSKAVFPVGKQYMGGYSDDWGTDRGANSHEGTDIMAPAGESIYSVIGGTVKVSAGASDTYYTDIGGYNVMVEATESVGPIQKGDRLYYAHMQQSPSVRDGDTVKAGDVIGNIGSTGYGPEVTDDKMPAHLHLGWYDLSGAREEAPSGAMDPFPLLEYLKGNGGTASGGGALAPGDSTPEECSSPLAKLFGFTGLGKRLFGGGSGEILGTGTGREVIEKAQQYLGVRYVLGGPAECVPGEKMDCTCLLTTVFSEFGYDGANALPDDPGALVDIGKPVTGEAQAGDIYVYADPGDATGGHAAIAMGDGRIIHANMGTMDTSISPSPESAGEIIAHRRLLPDD